jgi:carboxymethylenebutenolidase
MLIIDDEFTDVPTPTGPMRCHTFRPKLAGRYPGVIFYSEIFQMTGPIKRSAQLLAGHGYVVIVPEVYHELLEAGTVLSYTPEDSARGNACKVGKSVGDYDADTAAAVAFLQSHPACTGGKVGVAGVCLGGGLAFRAALNPDVACALCWCGARRSLGHVTRACNFIRAPHLAKTAFVAGSFAQASSVRGAQPSARSSGDDAVAQSKSAAP